MPFLPGFAFLDLTNFSPEQISRPGYKFGADSQWSFEQVYKFAYGRVLESLEGIASEIGRDRMIKIVGSHAEDCAREKGKQAAKSGKGDFKSFNDWARDPSRFWRHMLTFTIVEDTPNAFEFKITECLWAKTLCEAKSEDIGYAIICHPDFATASGYSPKLQLTRTKTLMEGNSCCNPRYIWQE